MRTGYSYTEDSPAWLVTKVDSNMTERIKTTGTRLLGVLQRQKSLPKVTVSNWSKAHGATNEACRTEGMIEESNLWAAVR